MTSPEEGLASQIRNIEATYGKSMGEWAQLVAASGRTKHSDIVSWLKANRGVTHGNANRIALVVRDILSDKSGKSEIADDPIAVLYQGRPPGLRDLHDRLMHEIRAFGSDVEVSPKRAYVSLRRKKQFAMVQPASDRLDIGLILKGAKPTARLELAGGFNAMFTHRVRVKGPADLDTTLVAWLKRAYDHAGG